MWIDRWAIAHGEHASIGAEASALKDGVARWCERVQKLSTRTFDDQDHAGVGFHHCNDTAIRTQDPVRLFGRLGSDAKTATSAQIPARPTAGNQLRTVRAERDVVSHVRATAQV